MLNLENSSEEQAFFKNPFYSLTFKTDYLTLILQSKVYSSAIETPLTIATNLSLKTKSKILLKREDLQPVFSFKVRGSMNKIQHLTEVERKKGVICCSAGNHAQGVALASSALGIKAKIIMPGATPEIKWKNCKRLGAEVILFGSDFEDCRRECARLVEREGLVDIPPYDDKLVIAGQGTIGLEIFRQYDYEEIDAIFVCVGGGGLIAGIASYVKRIKPSIKVIGVETFDANAMTLSLMKGERVALKEVGLFADGAAVRTVGKETFEVCKDLVDEMVLVSTDELCAAIKDVFEDTRAILEPAGALAVAGCKKWIKHHKIVGGTFVTTCSGANMNFDRLRFVADRAGFGEKTEALLNVIIPERPNSFLELYETLDPRTVTEFSYRYGDEKNAHIFLSILVRDDNEVSKLISDLEKKNISAINSSRNELAKAHARYLVGGRSDVKDERIFRFSFPERPGALKHFLQTMNHSWNVSLFHYRNFGGDVGKVLCGIQVPGQTGRAFEEFLEGLKYPYIEETGNEVYTRFLK